MVLTEKFDSYILIVLLVISFTLNPFLKKMASKKVTSNEFLIIYHFVASSFMILYFGVMIYLKKCDINCFKKLNFNDYIWTGICSIVGIGGAITLIYLIKLEDVSFIIPNIQGAVIGLSAIIGYFIFNENMDIYKIIGIILVFLGIITINYSKLKVNNK